MALDYYYPEEDHDVDAWLSAYSEYELSSNWDDFSQSPPVDIVAIAASILIILGLVFGFKLTISRTIAPVIPQPAPPDRVLPQEESVPQPLLPLNVSPSSISAPYDDYVLTQGIHGLSYGHMAIDIAAGKGAPIKSPISGTVSEYYFDAIGNPILVIENDLYRITMLHGEYVVSVGDELTIGDIVGTESNLGNTRDMQGNSCRNRDCGYHTHLNVFDKEKNSNINPLDVIGG